MDEQSTDHSQDEAARLFSASRRHWLRREAMRGRHAQDRMIARKLDHGFTASNNIYPSLFHSWPLRSGRVDKTVRALERIEKRRQFNLPTRQEYQSTADLYEAALPFLGTLNRLGRDKKAIAPVPSISIRAMLKNLKDHLYF